MLEELQSKDECTEILKNICFTIASLRSAVKLGLWIAEMSEVSVEKTLRDNSDFRKDLKTMEHFLKPIEDVSFTADREKR